MGSLLQYEAQDKPKEAIRMYSEAGRYNHAVRLARANGFDKEILSLALQVCFNRKTEHSERGADRLAFLVGGWCVSRRRRE